MNPGLIWGPTLSSRADGESVKMIQMMFSGMVRSGVNGALYMSCMLGGECM
jgi:hypothetical protein